MATAPDDVRLDELTRAHAAIVAEARAHVAAGREANAERLQARVRAAGDRERARQDESLHGAIASAERRALQQLDRVLSIARARASLSRDVAPPSGGAAPRRLPGRRAPIRTRPTITGNMDARARAEGQSVLLTWKTDATVTAWDVRFSERPDPRGDYVVREERTLPAAATSVELPLGEAPLRVHLHGRGRGDRVVRRALISGLTQESWNDRWQRRPTAS